MRVLVVEDYAPIQKAVAKGLREAGFAVDATGDGEEGLWYATSNDYDVVVLDLMLPGMDGLSILKRLRAEGRTTHVLILTAKDTVQDRVIGLDLGADDYLVKPFAFDELLARVRALARRAYSAKNPMHCRRRPADRDIDTARLARRRRDLAHGARVRAPRVPRAARGRRRQPHRHLGARLRIHVRGGLQRRGRLHRLPAEEDRTLRPAAAHPHGPRQRLLPAGTAMTLSIRTRLLVWVVGGMAVLLALFAVGLYAVISRALVASFDDVLASTARVISASVEQTDRELKADIDETDIPEFRRADRPDYFQVWREDGEVLGRSSSLKGASLDRFGGRLGTLVFKPVRLPDGRAGRAVGWLFTPRIDDEAKRPIQPPNAVLVVARGTGALDAEIAFLGWLLAIGTGGTIVLALLVGTVVVRQGLRPLETVAAQIGAIRDDDLTARIPVDRLPVELAPVVQRLNDLLQRLDAAFQRERTFTADAAHELRTPLAGLRSTLEVALTHPRGTAEYREALADCLEIVRHTQALVDSLLALARLDGGRRGYPARVAGPRRDRRCGLPAAGREGAGATPEGRESGAAGCRLRRRPGEPAHGPDGAPHERGGLHGDGRPNRQSTPGGPAVRSS